MTPEIIFKKAARRDENFKPREGPNCEVGPLEGLIGLHQAPNSDTLEVYQRGIRIAGVDSPFWALWEEISAIEYPFADRSARVVFKKNDGSHIILRTTDPSTVASFVKKCLDAHWKPGTPPYTFTAVDKPENWDTLTGEERWRIVSGG